MNLSFNIPLHWQGSIHGYRSLSVATSNNKVARKLKLVDSIWAFTCMEVAYLGVIYGLMHIIKGQNQWAFQHGFCDRPSSEKSQSLMSRILFHFETLLHLDMGF